MATPLNVEVLTGMGFDGPGRGRAQRHGRRASGSTTTAPWTPRWPASTQALRRAPAAATPDRPRRRRRGPRRARCVASAPGAIALVSVPGPSAFVEAMDALEAGRDVMVFSDNVPVEQELALKRYAAERGRCW